jgi:hypothetical protein
MKRALILLVVISGHVYGQQYVDLARLYYSNSSSNNFEASDSSTRVQEFGVDLTVPIVLSTRRVLLTGLFYEQTQTRLFATDPEQHLNVTGLRAGVLLTHSEKWSGTYLIVPKISGDYKEIGNDDFQIGAIALLKYTRHSRMSYKLGAYYNAELFGPMFVPLFGLYYQSANKKFESNLTLPFQADVSYQLHKRLHAGMNFNGQVRSFRLSEIQETGEEGYVVKTSNEVFSYLRFNLTEGLFLQLKGGYALGRHYRVYAKDDKIAWGSILIRVGDDRTQLNTDFSDGFVYQAMLIYRLNNDK